jgi:hypothetical protein
VQYINFKISKVCNILKNQLTCRSNKFERNTSSDVIYCKRGVYLLFPLLLYFVVLEVGCCSFCRFSQSTFSFDVLYLFSPGPVLNAVKSNHSQCVCLHYSSVILCVDFSINLRNCESFIQFLAHVSEATVYFENMYVKKINFPKLNRFKYCNAFLLLTFGLT